jgi:hypothetical protein
MSLASDSSLFDLIKDKIIKFVNMQLSVLSNLQSKHYDVKRVYITLNQGLVQPKLCKVNGQIIPELRV